MATKSPYELRTELLNMALHICSERHQAEHAKKVFEINQARTQDGVDCIPELSATSAPTTEEVITEAIKLNEFIQHKG